MLEGTGTLIYQRDSVRSQGAPVIHLRYDSRNRFGAERFEAFKHLLLLAAAHSTKTSYKPANLFEMWYRPIDAPCRNDLRLPCRFVPCCRFR